LNEQLVVAASTLSVVTGLSIDARIAATTVADAAAGDVDALARIVGAHHDDMARLAFVICGDQDLAQDAVQAAWPVAWRKLGTLRDPGSLRPWLMSVAANEARQLVRRQRRHPVVQIEVADVGSTHGDPGSRAGLLDLSAALRRLPADDRAILALRHVAGFDATEIGHALGMSPSGVRSRLARVIARLREELEDA
jgi:RNA polymerase sigma-70 factor, ECF subfamily